MNTCVTKAIMRICTVLSVATCGYARAQTTITLQPDPSDGSDASLGLHTNYNTANTNFGGDIWFKAYCIPGYAGGENTNRGLIAFDLSAIPADAAINSAELFLYAAGYVSELIPGHFGDNASYIRRVTSAWTESGVTWNTAPTSTVDGQVVVPASSSPTEDYIVDVTELVQGMVDDPLNNHGFLLQQQEEDPFDPSGLIFHSSDVSDPDKRPKLVVTYTSGTTICTQPDAGTGSDASPSFHTNYGTENNNFGDDPRFKAFCIPGAMGGNNTARGLIAFDLSILPSGAELLSAELSLFATGYVNDLIPGHFGSNGAWMRRVVEPWSEMSVTWNTQPLTTTDDQVPVVASSDPTEDYVIDVTGLVEASLADPGNSHGFQFSLAEENPNDPACLVFWSSDANDPLERPRLCLTYSLNGAVGEVELTERPRSIGAFPVPTTGTVHLNAEEGGRITLIQLIGSAGDVVFEWKNPVQAEGLLTLHLPTVVPGRYTLRTVGTGGVRFAPLIRVDP